MLIECGMCDVRYGMWNRLFSIYYFLQVLTGLSDAVRFSIFYFLFSFFSPYSKINPAFAMSCQNPGYDFLTTSGSSMQISSRTIASVANAIAMR